MTQFLLCSAKGAPGVTTAMLALAHAWPLTPDRRVLAVEADPAGGDAAAGFLRGSIGKEVGLAAVAADRTHPVVDAVIGHALALDESGRRLLLPGPWSVSHAALIVQLLAALTQVASNPEVDVLVDAGRLDPTSIAQTDADVVLLVTRSSLRAVAAARPLARVLAQRGDGRDDGRRVAAVVVGERQPYPADEVAAALGIRLAGSLAWDPGNAAVLSDGAAMSRRFPRSALMRSASALARALVATAEDSSVVSKTKTAPSVVSSAPDPQETTAAGVAVVS